jgi:hypothetical protein
MYKTQPSNVSNLQLTCEIAKPKVWDASALRPNKQSNNHLNEARMASKAHRAKIPQEWTTGNATIGDKPKKGELNSHDPKSTSGLPEDLTLNVHTFTRIQDMRTGDDLRYHYLSETSVRKSDRQSKSQKSQVNFILKTQ